MATSKTAAKPAAAKAPKAAKVPAAPKEKKPGVGDMAKELIKQGLTNEQVIAKVQAKFPDSKISSASVAWYRGKVGVKAPRPPKAEKPAKVAKAAAAKPAAKSAAKKAA